MIDQKPLELSPAYKYVLDSLEKTNVSMFITGRAGTGKSTLLQLLRKTTRKKTVVVAPTGIAALNVQGQTIHSFFGFPPKMIGKRDIKKRQARWLKLYQRIEMLIIDEISMVRADMLDNIDYFLRLNRDRHEPFGGVQMVLFGDLFQLPPIVASDAERHIFSTFYDSPYFFSAKVLEEIELEKVELRKVYRQEARYFVRLLDAVRTNQLDYEDLEDLNERHQPLFEPTDRYITLSARNATVNKINTRKLDEIPLPARTYTAKVTGNFNPKLYPTDLILQLKLNAQVMFIKNDPDREFVNGTLGKVVKMEDNSVTVLVEQADKSKYIKVGPMDWDVVKYKPNANPKDLEKGELESESVGSFTQLPLKLAWALTIHKAQGKTFDRVIIDLGRGAFAHGQTYVALSRCRTLDGIVLKQRLRAQDVLVDDRVVQYYEQHF